jgi:hypothetical protein
MFKSLSNDLSLRNSLLKQVLLEVVASMPVTNVDGVLRVSNTFSSLTSNPNEININSAVSLIIP